MSRQHQLSAALVVLSCLHPTAMSESMKPRRSPGPEYWMNTTNGSGPFANGQEACDGRFLGLVYVAETEYKGRCLYPDLNWGGPGAYAGRGQECPLRYTAKDYVAWIGGGVYGNSLNYGPSQYCEGTWNFIDRWHDKPHLGCSAGNPIFPLTGTKRQSETLVQWLPGLSAVSITYDNRRKLPNSDQEGRFAHVAAPSFGGLWESSLHKRLVFQTGGSPGRWKNVQASRGAATWTSFTRPTGQSSWLPDNDVTDRITALTSGWRYKDVAAQTQETYDSLGILQSVASAQGGRQLYTYSDSNSPANVAPTTGLLIKVQNQFGRAVHFEYEQPEGVELPRIARILDPDGQGIQAVYDAAGNLSRLNWPDGRTRTFLYEHGALPWALTGIVDENNDRHSTYSYDDEGRAVSTEYAGGVGRYSISYGSPPRWVSTETFDAANLVFWRDHSWQPPQDAVLTNPSGVAVAMGATLVNGMPRVTTRSQPAGAGCDASSSTLAYDANGNVTSKTDFNGTKSCHAYDLSRNLETARLEGLAGLDACPTDIVAQEIAAGTAQRKTVTLWHPDWSLPVKNAEPGKITTNVYNGQPDPTAGNAVAACAPTTATLPDGKRIVVLCKKVEQATTDATGALGFSAAPTGTPRTWTYTYNEHGQVLTARDPLNNLTTYTYHPETTADYTKGDLKSVTNPAGHTAQYTRYDKSGRLLESVDANGTKTETTYTPRGWVKTVTTTPSGTTAQATVYDYDGVGQLKKATLPDGTVLEYAHDAAHRLRSVKDAAGNAVTYTLDNMGNRTREELKDASGTLARNITRVYDALNRVQGMTGLGQ
jgi:YD repeat-containing protein